MRIIVAIGHDLVWKHGRVCLGLGSKKSCLAAIRLASENPSNSRVLVCAGKAGANFIHAPMGQLMIRFINRLCQRVDCSIRLDIQEASEFDTFGEIAAAAEYAQDIRLRYPNAVIDVVFCAKEAHAIRVKFLSFLVFTVWKKVRATDYWTEVHRVSEAAWSKRSKLIERLLIGCVHNFFIRFVPAYVGDMLDFHKI